jgi:hypothetical protein
MQKYTSRQMLKYKEKVDRLVALDKQKYIGFDFRYAGVLTLGKNNNQH